MQIISCALIIFFIAHNLSGSELNNPIRILKDKSKNNISDTQSSSLDNIWGTAYFAKQLKEVDFDSEIGKLKNIVLSSNNLQTAIQVQDLSKFIENGGNLLWVLDSQKIGKYSGEFAGNFGFYFYSSPIQDYFTDAGKNGSHLIFNDNCKSEIFTKSTTLDADKKYSGNFHVHDKSNPLIIPIISATRTAISENPKAYGTDIMIASALQSRLGSRITILHYSEAISDQILRDLFDWTFSTNESLSFDLPKVISSKTNRATDRFRVGDKVNVEICSKSKQYLPNHPKNLQMTIGMMKNNSIVTKLFPNKNGCFESASFNLPQMHGTYKLQIFNFHEAKPIEKKIVVRPFNKDEENHYKFDASLLPYYFSWMSVLFSTSLIVIPAIALIK